MSPRPRVVPASGLLLLSWTSACSPEVEVLPAPSYTGERVTVATDFETPLCAGDIADFDRAIERIDARLELDASGLTELFILGSTTLYERHCGEQTGGCHYDDQPRAFVRRHRPEAIWHEFVHDRASRSARGNLNDAPVLFVEGLADAFDPPSCVPSQEPDFPDTDSLLAARVSTQLPPLAYFLGGELMRWLLETHGAAQVQDFMLALDSDDDATQIRAVYAEQFGGSLDEDLHGHITYGSEGYDPASLGCRGQAPPVDETGRVHALQATLDCASAQVRSAFSDLDADPNSGHVEWVLELEADAGQSLRRLVLDGEIPEGTQLSYARCECQGLPSTPNPAAEAGPSELELQPWPASGVAYFEPGTYRLLWSGPLDGAELDVVLEQDCRRGQGDCPSGQQCSQWSECVPEVPDPALPGQACVEPSDGPASCAEGSVCVGLETDTQTEGLCTTYCSDDDACADAERCSVWGLCGSPCDVLAQDCPEGHACQLARTDGVGLCLPSAQLGVGERCDDIECAPGLACEPLDQLEGCAAALFAGCCVPICEPGPDPGCPVELPNCEPDQLGLAAALGLGVCVP